MTFDALSAPAARTRFAEMIRECARQDQTCLLIGNFSRTRTAPGTATAVEAVLGGRQARI